MIIFVNTPRETISFEDQKIREKSPLIFVERIIVCR
jgi:hypothetical protein